MQEAHADEQVTCSKGSTHEGMPLMMICLQKNCARKRLCCLSCIDQLHVKHELMSLKKFYKYVEQTTNYNLNVKDKNQTINTIDTIHKSVHDSLEKIKYAFETKINQIYHKIEAHFQQIKESFIHEKLKNVCENIRSQFTDSKIEEYYQLIKKAEGNLSRPLDEIKKLVATTEKSVSEKIVTFVKEIDKNLEIIAKDVLLFRIAKNNNQKDEFNQQTKSVYLSLGEDGKTAKRTEGSGGYPIAVVKQQFTPDHNTVAFKITEQLGAKGIWMGVCVLDVVKNLNYQSCYGIGKGTWGIDQVGQNHASAYSWSHHDTNYNSCPKVGWQFWIGDVVEITVDFDKGVARFCKNKQHYYQQPIKLDLGPVYAFAGPTHINDTISIA